MVPTSLFVPQGAPLVVPPVVQKTEGRTLGSKAAGNISQKMNVSVNTGWKNETTQKYRLEKRHNTEIQAGKVQYHQEITFGKIHLLLRIPGW